MEIKYVRSQLQIVNSSHLIFLNWRNQMTNVYVLIIYDIDN